MSTEETKTTAADGQSALNRFVSVDGIEKKISGNFYINEEAVEHSCCWNTAVCFETEEGDGMYGGSEVLLLECSKDAAEFILTALNSKLNASR